MARRPRPKGKRGGRREWYPTPRDIDRVKEAISEGETLESVARSVLHIAPSTLFKWLKAHPSRAHRNLKLEPGAELSEAIDEAVSVLVGKVERKVANVSMNDKHRHWGTAVRIFLPNRGGDTWRKEARAASGKPEEPTPKSRGKATVSREEVRAMLEGLDRSTRPAKKK